MLFGLIFYVGLTTALNFQEIHAAAAILYLFVVFAVQFIHIPPALGSIAFVVFATSISTLIWLILHVLSILILRAVPPIFSILETDKRPVRSIGLVASVIVWPLGLIVAVVTYFSA